MHRKLALISAFLLLCGPFSAEGFDVFHSPGGSGINPQELAGIPRTTDSVALDIWV
jgi:hypothetical protein